MASYGHLTQLSSLKNIDMANNFTPTFQYYREKKLNKLINYKRQ